MMLSQSVVSHNMAMVCHSAVPGRALVARHSMMSNYPVVASYTTLVVSCRAMSLRRTTNGCVLRHLLNGGFRLARCKC